MRKIINCGKIDWNGTGRKINQVELELRLEQKDGHWCFSCCGSVWNSRHSDVVAGGQCIDEIFRHPGLSKWKELHELWAKHHLNDLTPGSPKQESAVKKWMSRSRANNPYDYVKIRGMLESEGLFVDESYIHDGRSYEYGTAWLTRDIPDDDLARIKKWMES